MGWHVEKKGSQTLMPSVLKCYSWKRRREFSYGVFRSVYFFFSSFQVKSLFLRTALKFLTGVL